MIINDLSMISTKLEVWKAYLKIDPTPEKYQLQMELNALLLQDLSQGSIMELEKFFLKVERSMNLAT